MLLVNSKKNLVAKRVMIKIFTLLEAVHSLLPSLFPQPVHNNGSSGYGSLGSNGSHEHYISVASSSDSNGNLWEDSHREPVRRRITSTASLASFNSAAMVDHAGVCCDACDCR